MASAEEYARRQDVSRRKVLAGMLGTAGLAAAGGGISSWMAQAPARAAGALLKPGSRPYPTKAEGTDTIPEIEHIIIYMNENQSYDHYFGTLGKGDGFTMSGGSPTNSNVDGSGNTITVFHQESTCNAISGDHSWNGTHLEINGGKMDGFAKVSGDNVMGYYDETNLPFYRGLANHFPLCDRWFCSVPGPTYPNRRFLQAATSMGIVATDINEVLATPTAANGTIWDRLNSHGISWIDYGIDIWDVVLFPTKNVSKFLTDTYYNRKWFADFLVDCKKGTLPQVSILAPGAHDQYDEGSQDVQNGEAYGAAIINAVMDSPVWDKSIILCTWDEHGGGYDHVPPPPAAAPDNVKPRITASDQQGGFDMYGVRVGGLVVSPYSKPGYVSSVVHDHTSILKFIETKFNLGAMTYRDANANNLLECLDFSTAAFREPPTLPAPGIPATGSTCEPQPKPADFPRGQMVGTPPPSTTTTTTTAPGGTTTTTAPVGSAPPATPIVAPANFTG